MLPGLLRGGCVLWKLFFLQFVIADCRGWISARRRAGLIDC